MREYTATRHRGLAPWRPQARTLGLIEQVHNVLEEYADFLPLTCRQVFYRLVGAYGFDKTEAGYDRLLTVLNRGRRSGLFDFDAIRDDGTIKSAPSGFDGTPHFWQAVRSTAHNYRRDRLHGPPGGAGGAPVRHPCLQLGRVRLEGDGDSSESDEAGVAVVRSRVNPSTSRCGSKQAEALAPDQLADEIRQAVETILDLGQLAVVQASEDEERAALMAAVAELGQ